MKFTDFYKGFSWIRVKKYKEDITKSYEERYKELESHHVAETKFLVKEVRKLSELIEKLLSEETKTVRCLENGDYTDLIKGSLYKSLPTDDKDKKFGLIRVLDESGEDYLYPVYWFQEVK
jgi:hypothetical protein